MAFSGTLGFPSLYNREIGSLFLFCLMALLTSARPGPSPRLLSLSVSLPPSFLPLLPLPPSLPPSLHLAPGTPEACGPMAPRPSTVQVTSCTSVQTTTFQISADALRISLQHLKITDKCFSRCFSAQRTPAYSVDPYICKNPTTGAHENQSTSAMRAEMCTLSYKDKELTTVSYQVCHQRTPKRVMLW